ncbi:hypothetical protein ASF27_02335 [Methylobacterium sp. Leaf102]|uniref:hypothetical protein n=1 Tax=Methylobacterium sp. Leaf102 TaxID=1736253 RepID=UPI0006F85FE8|nr:hypothetical protein [Methylobacterium sp. Leaf102]KQP34406.1 hypothetical protein ASF27_02335 [Methylobacterium sp. Leaf102]KQP36802.1 hypothetical protein ASF25_02340 [Methylobacterium sp. Leaf100]
MAPAIARLLPDFSVPATASRPPAAFPASANSDASEGLAVLLRVPSPAVPAPPPEDRAALLKDAEARGRAEGRTQAQAESAAALAFAQADFDARLAAARADWCAAESDRLAAGFSAAIHALGGQLTDRVGNLLVPVLTAGLRRQAVDELALTLAQLLGDPRHAPVRIGGPADLLDALAGKLGAVESTVAFSPSETVEVTIQSDQTLIETQLGAWAGLLTAAVEGA